MGKWQQLHQIYLRSDEWKQVKKLVTERDENCKKCGRTDGPFEVHHTSYRHWREANHLEVDDCELLCRDCHQEIHKIKSKKKFLNVQPTEDFFGDLREDYFE